MNEASLARLEVSLERWIQRWIDQQRKKGDSWGAVGYIGPNISHHMAGAAMYLLRSSADINQYFQVRDE